MTTTSKMSLETLHDRLLPCVGTSTYYRFFTGDSLILYWKRAEIFNSWGKSFAWGSNRYFSFDAENNHWHLIRLINSQQRFRGKRLLSWINHGTNVLGETKTYCTGSTRHLSHSQQEFVETALNFLLSTFWFREPVSILAGRKYDITGPGKTEWADFWKQHKPRHNTIFLHKLSYIGFMHQAL